MVPVVSFDDRGAPVLEPRILSRGFVPEDDDSNNNGLLGEAQRLLEVSLSRIPPAERNDEARVRSLIESDLRRFLRRRTQRRPVIAPVIVER